MARDKMKYQDVDYVFNIKEEDLSILEKNFTSPDTNIPYYNYVENDYDGKRMIPISAMEYKNMLLMEFFIKNLIRSGATKKWRLYQKNLDDAIESYRRTFNLAIREVSKLQQQEVKEHE